MFDKIYNNEKGSTEINRRKGYKTKKATRFMCIIFTNLIVLIIIYM